MKVYLHPHEKISLGVRRVAMALALNAPKGVELVGTREKADLVIHHVVGVMNLEDIPLNELIERDGKRYAMIQYCWKTTENGGDPTFWGPLWGRAECVWSYYDLSMSTDFYYAPLGVDQEKFVAQPNVPKLFTCGTSGYIYETEGVREVNAAIERVGGYQFHLGPDHGGLGTHAAVQTGLSDEQVARRWQECDYVSGLRKDEGFELPAAEAAVVGTRPLLYDTPTYRQWYGEFGVFIQEDADVVASLIDLFFAEPPKPFTKAERKLIAERFNWKRLTDEFWRRIL